MKRLTLAAVAAGALLPLLAPAAGLAQPYGQPGPGWDHGSGPGQHGGWDHGPGPGQAQPGGWDLDRRIDWMQTRITRGRDDGSLDRREARRAQRSLDSIRNDERQMKWRHHGWLRDSERATLQARLDQLNDQLRWLRHNDERRPW
jgi:hypothetical protein